MIDTNTSLVALLGYPLEHSLSPLMHNTIFKELNLNYRYLPIEIKENNLAELINAFRFMNIIGFNVTKPHKIKVMEYLDEIDELTEKIAAVNTVKKVNGKLVGYNTDGIGFIKSFEEELDSKIKNKSFLILGAGGASRSIAFNLANKGAEKIIIIAKHYDYGSQLCSGINELGKTSALHFNLKRSKIKEALKRVDVLINATGVGMYPEVNKSPIDKELLNDDLIVCDLIYNPLKSKLLEDAEEIGARTLNGLGMLIYQGAEAFKIWTGKEAPVEKMFKIIYDEINNSNWMNKQ